MTCGLQTVTVPRREDDTGSSSASKPGGLETDSGAAADHDDSLPVEFWFVSRNIVVHRSSSCLQCSVYFLCSDEVAFALPLFTAQETQRGKAATKQSRPSPTFM